MFIAMEISSDNVRWGSFPWKQFNTYFSGILSTNRSCSYFKSLAQKVKEQMEHVRANLLKEYVDPGTALTPEPEQKPPLVHTPRHDAESVFWLLWFLLARANPKSEPPVEKGSAEKQD